MDKAIQKKTTTQNRFLKMNIVSNIKKFMRTTLYGEKVKLDDDTLARRELLEDIEETLMNLRYARSCFENAKDPEVIEACVYEIKSAETRYSFLLRKAKLLGEKSSEIAAL